MIVPNVICEMGAVVKKGGEAALEKLLPDHRRTSDIKTAHNICAKNIFKIKNVPIEPNQGALQWREVQQMKRYVPSLPFFGKLSIVHYPRFFLP